MSFRRYSLSWYKPRTQEFTPDNESQHSNQEDTKDPTFLLSLKITVFDLETAGFTEHKSQQLKSSILS